MTIAFEIPLIVSQLAFWTACVLTFLTAYLFILKLICHFAVNELGLWVWKAWIGIVKNKRNDNEYYYHIILKIIRDIELRSNYRLEITEIEDESD